MATQGGFPILIDAFLAVNSVEDAAALELNDRVKRILFPRIQEFKSWLEQSERELRNRYEIEKNYLRSQVNSLKLYSRWAKPYLLSAQKLEQKISKSAALVNSLTQAALASAKEAQDDVPTGVASGGTARYSCWLSVQCISDFSM